MHPLLLTTLAATSLLAPAPDDRLGKTAEEILGMGHTKWVKWYCDPSRRGAQGRVGAEHEYCTALHERNEKLSAAKPERERVFLDETRAMLADFSKSAFFHGTTIRPEWDGWSLAIAESSTAVNKAVSDLLLGAPINRPISRDHVDKEFLRQVQFAKNSGKLPNENETVRMSGIFEKLQKRCDNRSTDDQQAIRRFLLKVVPLISGKQI